MKRIEGYDLARALAILGMVIVNFRLVMTDAAWGRDTADSSWFDLLGLLEGRAAAVFVVLAGVGVSLGARRAVASGDALLLRAARKSLWKRSALLFVGGLVFAAVWPADILHFYGWYLGIGALLIALPDRRLLWTAGLLTLGFVVLVFGLDYEAGWDFATFTYTDFWTLTGQVRHLFFNGFHPVIPWLAFFALGLWLGRRNLLDPAVRRRVLVVGLALALAAETMSALLLRSFGTTEALDAEEVAALFGTSPMPPMPLYMLAASGTALVVIALSVWFSSRFAHLPGHGALLATGRLSLTIYIAHVLLGMGLLEAAGRLEHQSQAFALTASLVFFVAAVRFAALWTRRFERGPFEWALRRLAG